MFESSMLKFDRATIHIRELIKLLAENRAFSYVLETNTQTGERATFAKTNKAVISTAALICGDIVHNLRSALDHAFWEVVSPFAKAGKEERVIQFPFCETAARLDEAIKNRLADRVSTGFFDAIKALKPYGEVGGNEMLWFVHELDLQDKHRLLTPMGDYKRITGKIIQPQVPDFPAFFGTVFLGENARDIVWRSRGPFSREDLGNPRPPTTHLFERELDVPVDVVFSVDPRRGPREVVDTLNGMSAATKECLATIRDAIT